MTALITAMTTVFDAVFTWFGGALETVSGILYVDGSLTLIGTLCIIALAISVFLLIFNIVKSCFNLR